MSSGQTGFVPGTKWVCPRDKPRFSPYFTQRKPSLSLGQTRFVPGTFRGRRPAERVYVLKSDSVKRHLRGRHLSVLNLKFDFISDGGCTREEQIALSLKRHLFPHGGREPKAFWICFSRVRPPSEIKSNFKFKALKRHLLKRHLTLSDKSLCASFVP